MAFFYGSTWEAVVLRMILGILGDLAIVRQHRHQRHRPGTEERLLAKIFLTIVIVIAVFGMRLLLPPWSSSGPPAGCDHLTRSTPLALGLSTLRGHLVNESVAQAHSLAYRNPADLPTARRLIPLSEGGSVTTNGADHPRHRSQSSESLHLRNTSILGRAQSAIMPRRRTRLS
jgi:hypothetical protein